MEKASNGQFRNLVGNLNMVPENAINLIDGTLIQRAINECGSGTTQAEFVKWINNGCRLTFMLANAFTVGEVFRHQVEVGDRRLWLSDNTQNWLVKPNMGKVVPIPSSLRKLSEYRLPSNMNDSSIQEVTNNPDLMSEEEFFVVMYLAIFQPQFAKQFLGFTLQKHQWYIFHVMVGGEKMAFCVGWDGGEWSFGVFVFGAGGVWGEGRVFVSFTEA